METLVGKNEVIDFAYYIKGNFRKVYILHFSQFDRIYKSLSHEFVNITIQTHNTSTQIAKLIELIN